MSKTICANCGAALADPGAVCEACERAFEAAPADQGRYCCPLCEKHFNRAATVWLPEKVAWYKPQAPAPQCPHCKAVLHDRLATEPRPWERWVLPLILVLSPFMPRLLWLRALFLAIIVIAGGVQLWRLRALKRALTDASRRYGPQQQGK